MLMRLLAATPPPPLLCAGPRAGAQEAAAPPPQDAEREAVRRVVETHLYADDVDEKKPVTDEVANVLSVGRGRGRVKATPARSEPREPPKGATNLRTGRSPRRVAAIEVPGGAASVEVSTDFTPDDRGDEAGTHRQLFRLLKVKGEWGIVGILMPDPARRLNPRPPTDR